MTAAPHSRAVLAMIASAMLAGWWWSVAPGGTGLRAAPPIAQAEPQGPAGAAPDEPSPPAWRIMPGGRLGFSTSLRGMAIAGQFSRWAADVRFSRDRLDMSTITATVDLASATMADSQHEQMARGPSFLDAEASPAARFTAGSMRRLDGDRYEANGALTLRGATRPVRLLFTLRIDGGTAHVSGRASLDRSAFGVGTGEWAATDAIPAEVGVSFDFDAVMRD